MSNAVAPAPKRNYRMAARAEAAAATRDRILDAAWRLFSERAYEHVRMTDIAAQASVTVQTLHARFGTKDALFVAAWRWRWAPEMVRRDSTSPGDERAAVRALYDSYDASADAAFRLLAQEDSIAAVHDMADEGRAWHRGWVERTFHHLFGDVRGAERERRVIKLVVATDVLVWKLLRREMALDRRTAERIVIEMILAVKGVS